MATAFPSVGHLKEVFLDLLFPRWCIGCGREGSYVCDSCRSTFTAIVPPVCPRCGRPLGDGGDCTNCTGNMPYLNGIRAPFLFGGILRQAIHDFKYNNLRALAPFFGGLLADYLERFPLPGDTLMPVPLHPKRLRSRGYNQAMLVAGCLGTAAGLPVVDGLERTRYVTPQASVADRETRYAGVAGGFICRDSGLLEGKKILLVDDVSTTGATLDACAQALKAAGAEEVWGLAIALEL